MTDVIPIGMHEVMRKTTYAPLPWETHPIDTVVGPQGWGPFEGPYSPKDYLPQGNCAGISGLDIGYNKDPFLPDHGPGYSEVTIFTDRSTDLVNGVLTNAQNNGAQHANPAYSSTISNAIARSKDLSGAAATAASIKSAVLKYLQ